MYSMPIVAAVGLAQALQDLAQADARSGPTSEPVLNTVSMSASVRS